MQIDGGKMETVTNFISWAPKSLQRVTAAMKLRQLVEKNAMRNIQFSSVTQSCPTLCDTKDCSTPGYTVHQRLQELVQTHVH